MGTLPILKKGALAFYDSNTGLIPCKVVSIVSGGRELAEFVTIQITAKRTIYEKGQVISGLRWLWVIPRKAVKTRNGHHVRVLAYNVEVDKN